MGDAFFIFWDFTDFVLISPILGECAGGGSLINFVDLKYSR